MTLQRNPQLWKIYRTSEAGDVRLLLVVVVAFALSDFDIVIGDAIDDAVGVVDAAAPEAFVVALERFWFAETFEGMAVDVI